MTILFTVALIVGLSWGLLGILDTIAGMRSGKSLKRLTDRLPLNLTGLKTNKERV